MKPVYNDQKTPLHLAAKFGKTAIVKLLLEHDANKDAPGPFDFTALHYAVSHGHAETLTLLIQAGCNTQAKNKVGATIFNMTVHKKNDQVRALLKAEEQKQNN